MQKFFWIQKIRIEELYKKSTKNLTREDIKFLKKMWIINGCGGKDCRISKFFAKFFSRFFFEASCEIHDFGYWKWGDKFRRKECDKKFLAAMKSDARRQNIFLRPYFYMVAYGFYIMVRIFWKKYFNYRNF